ncbi:MAG: hypothetical protein HUU50_18980 [Candidatus Brocadiae bacterium]|nr:hypothetical protein [Candidatus Brocadiia bacterium]
MILNRLLLLVLLVAGVCYAKEKVRLAVLPFQTVGEIENGAGRELSGLVANALSSKYEVKERVQVSDVMKEKMLALGNVFQTKEIEEFQKQFAVDFLLMGQVSRGGQEYMLLLRLCDLNQGAIRAFLPPIHAVSWDGLKSRLELALRDHEPIVLVRPVKVVIRVVDENQVDRRISLLLEGEHKYEIQDTAKVLPGRYKVKSLDPAYQEKDLWIDIKANLEEQTLEIEVVSHGFRIRLLLVYSGVGAAMLSVVFLAWRQWRKRVLRTVFIPQGIENKKKEAIELARKIRVQLKDLLLVWKENTLLSRTMREADTLVNRIEMMSQKDGEKVPLIHSQLSLVYENIQALQNLAKEKEREKAEQKIQEISSVIKELLW